MRALRTIIFQISLLYNVQNNAGDPERAPTSRNYRGNAHEKPHDEPPEGTRRGKLTLVLRPAHNDGKTWTWTWTWSTEPASTACEQRIPQLRPLVQDQVQDQDQVGTEFSDRMNGSDH